MGLDAVEIVMECEDEFGICIPDADASRVTTMGELYALILRLRGTPAVGGQPAVGFALVAEALRESGVSIGELDPLVPLASIVPAGKRRAFWTALDAKFGGRLPDLVALRWGCGAAIAWMVVCALLGSMLGLPGILAGLIIGGMAWWIAATVLREFRPTFPRRWSTAQEIIDRTVLPMSDEAVWTRLVAIIVGQLTVRPEEVTPEARLIEDLKMG